MEQYAIKMKNITKKFGHVIANKNINLELKSGEILSLLGENGSGKTTLMNMLGGIYYPDEGSIEIMGEPATIASPKDSFKYGIGMIHQHFKLVDVFTAAENIILGLEGDKGKLDRQNINKAINEIATRYGFDIDPDKKVYDMSVSEKQTVEIVKVLYRGADILILDEPTAVLTPQEVEKLFLIMRNMKEDGKAIIIITHHLQEVMEISDRVAILRKGEYIGCVNKEDTSIQELTDMMVGRSVSLNINCPKHENPQELLRVENITNIDREGVKQLDNVSFSAYGGEILGIAGIAGSGQKELLEAISGIQPLSKESKIIYKKEDGSEINLVTMDPLDIINHGILLSFVPEDRFGMGLVGGMNIVDNIKLRTYREGKGVLVNNKIPSKEAKEIVENLEVVCSDIDKTPIRRLSGGNVQKVLVGREIACNPRVLMTAYAVRGLDINTSYTIYDLLTKQKMSGVAVIYVGEDLDVLLSISDRILVLCGGKVSGILDARATTKEEIGLYMTQVGGGKNND